MSESALKLFGSWWFPAHEEHLLSNMSKSAQKLMLNGRPTYQGKKQVAALERCKQRRVAVDVGAHIGLWSYNLAHVFEIVEAFEPVALHRVCFIRNIPPELASRVHLHAEALGKRKDSIDMCTEKGSSGNTTVGGAGTIYMCPLDSFELPVVDFLKVDCEGYEENVLRGAEATLRRCWPVIVVEQKRDMAERFGLRKQGALDFLKSLGYTIDLELSGDFIMLPPKVSV